MVQPQGVPGPFGPPISLMRIRLLSDLHLEFGAIELPGVEADVVVLAGDIHTDDKGVKWAQKTFSCPVVYVPGNHECYGGSLHKAVEHAQRAAKGSNVVVLDAAGVVIEGVRFLGGTLWTDYRLTGNQPLAMWDAQLKLSDFRKIRNRTYSKLRPEHVLQEHARHRAFLTDELQKPFSGKTVVVTHHAPSVRSLHPRYQRLGGNLNAAYASDLEHLMDGSLALWVHGHSHDSADYNLNGTRVVCNPRGYTPSHLNLDFDPGLVLEV